MDEDAIKQYLADTFPDLQSQSSPDGASFFFVGGERKFPFATLVTSDAHDNASQLDRPGIFRLNIGVSRETFRTLFDSSEDGTYDFAALDTFLPHPVYGSMFWISALNPGEATWEKTRSLLAEAHDLAASRQEKRTDA